MFLLILLFPSRTQATIRYTVSLAQPEQHLFRVTMVVPDVRDSLTVSLPAWNALYQIRDFSQRVLDVRAADGNGRPLPVSKLDKQTWRVSSTGTVTLYYSIYWDEPGPFASQLNPTHAFLNLAMVLFYVPDRRAEDVAVVFEDLQPSWRIAVALKPATGAASVISPFIAPSYDALVDAPVEIGPFEEFRLAGITPPVRVVIHGENYDRSQLEDSLRRIVIYQTALMGGAPYDEFLFIYHYGPSSIVGGGGMEHANSTAISASTFPGVINVGAHEFFHLWNVKRIRPQSLEPVDYSREQYARALWFAEGVTSTYGSYTLVRTGLWTPRQFYDDLANQITTLESRPARAWQSVEQSSLDAWLEKYPLYGRTEFSISYYNKGQLVGVLLDILLRDQTDNRASLDDVLRYLNDNFARHNRPYRDSDLLAASRAVLPRALQFRPASAQAPASRWFFSLSLRPAAALDRDHLLTSRPAASLRAHPSFAAASASAAAFSVAGARYGGPVLSSSSSPHVALGFSPASASFAPPPAASAIPLSSPPISMVVIPSPGSAGRGICCSPSRSTEVGFVALGFSPASLASSASAVGAYGITPIGSVILRPSDEDGRRISTSTVTSNVSFASSSLPAYPISQLSFATSLVDPPDTLDEFFARYVSGTLPLDYDFFFSKAGLTLKSRPRKQPNSASPLLFYEIEELPNPTDKQRRIRDALLRGTTDPPR